MSQTNGIVLDPDLVSQAFEHSITWEDDIWRADPVDVTEVHDKARRKFHDLLTGVTQGGATVQNRILLFHGQSGAGKTHLLRALRTATHRAGQAYFGYAQMTPDVGNYADYYLRRLIHSFEKPYDPDNGPEKDKENGKENGKESALARLTNRLVETTGTLSADDLKQLRDSNLNDGDLARLVMRLADTIVVSPKFADLELDANIVRALLYLQRQDARIDQRVRQYLHGRELTPLAHEAVAALDPNTGEDRAFEIITALGQLVWTVDRAALVFCIDQVEDLRFFDNAEERFQRAVRDLIQITNRVTNAIVIISCLDDFYGEVRGVLAQSYIDRIEKAGPVALIEARTSEEARQIIAKRLEHEAKLHQNGAAFSDPVQFLGPEFFEEFGGLSTRRLLEHAQTRLHSKAAGQDEETAEVGDPSFISRLAAALGFGGAFDGASPEPDTQAPPDYREAWQRFESASEAEPPTEDRGLLDLLATAIKLAQEEWPETVDVRVVRVDIADDLPAFDFRVTHRSGFSADSRVFLCNRPTQGGGLKRQLDKVLSAMAGKTCFILRASEFPPNRKNQTAQAFRKFRDAGGRSILVPIPEWERMLTVRDFHAAYRQASGFGAWFQTIKLLSGLVAMVQLLRLDLLGKGSLKPAKLPTFLPSETILDAAVDGRDPFAGIGHDMAMNGAPDGLPDSEADTAASWPSLESDPLNMTKDTTASSAPVEELPLAVILDETGGGASSIMAGRETTKQARPVTLNPSVMKRHSAFLGGSGSGKTTLALTLIEQMLMRGIPAVLIDRKGDLCSYANPDVWREGDGELGARRGERERLADAIDVAVYTPGRASGRPISITLLPHGINELPDQEQQLLANLSAAALGDMLHLKNSATHQKQWGTLSVALRILGGRQSREVSLGDLILFLEDEDAEFTDRTQRMDPSGKIRRDLVAQLDSLRHRNSTLFEGGGEPLRMDTLLGLGRFAKPGRTRLSIIYTGFLGDNENILFWVAQFLSEALRFCQRNPNDELQALVMFDEADLYIPASSKPATAEPLQSLLKRARSAGLGLMLATQSPGDLDYKSRDQITSWFIGRVREDTALRKLKAAFQSESGLDPAIVLPHQGVGEFHLVQEGLLRAIKAQRSLIQAKQVPFDRIEQLARETRGHDQKQLHLFD